MAELNVQEWFSELDRALEYRKLFGLEPSWASIEQIFYNVAGENANAGSNIVYSTGDAMMSALSVPYPYVTVKAKRSDYIPASRIVESVDNSLIEEMGMQKEVEFASLNAYLFGRGILKIGYDSEWGWDQEFDLGGRGMPIGMTLNRFSKDGDSIEYDSKIQPGMPWVRSVMPHDFLVPWGTRDLDDAPWVAHRVIRHIDDLRADPRYKTRGLRPTMSMKDFVRSYSQTAKLYRISDGTITTGATEFEGSGDVEFVELWEIREKKRKKIYVIAAGSNSFLRNDVDSLQMSGFPYVSFAYVPRSRNFWVTPDAYYLLQHQSELADIAVQRQKNRRIYTSKMIYQEDAFEPGEIDNLLSPNVGAAVKVKPGRSLVDAVMNFAPGYNQFLPQEEESVRSNAREQVGFSRNQMGEFNGSGRHSATEASVVAQASNLRVDRRQAVIASVYGEAFQKINPMIMAFWTLPRVTELLDAEGGKTWTTFSGVDIQGDFKYKIRFATDEPQTLQGRKIEALQLYSTLRSDPLVDPVQLTEYMSRAFADVELDGIFHSPLVKMQQQMMMQQMMAGQQPQMPQISGPGGQQNGSGQSGKPQSPRGGGAQPGQGALPAPVGAG